MEVSRLNPHAAPFVPGAYRVVEDYSPEWWSMVESSAGFRDYWLRECFHAEEEARGEDELDGVFEDDLADADALFHSYRPRSEVEEVKVRGTSGLELLGWGTEKWRAVAGRPDGPKYFEKAPKIVSMKVGRRTIQQPRCKKIQQASSSRIVGRIMNVCPASTMRLQERDNYLHLLKNCARSRNIDAACILCIEQCFNLRGMLNSAIEFLSQAKKEGHEVATYFLGIIILQGHEKEREIRVKMLELLTDIFEGRQLGEMRVYSTEEGKEKLKIAYRSFQSYLRVGLVEGDCKVRFTKYSVRVKM